MLVLIALALVVVVAMGWTFQRRILFPRHMAALPERGEPLAEAGLSGQARLERFEIEHDQGKTESWLVLPTERAPRALVVYTHGNGEVIDDLLPHLRDYVVEGYALALPEYRGYGHSDGDPTVERVLADLEVFYGRLRADPRLADLAVIIHGRSLGGGFAAELARRHRPAAAIFESTFTSIADRAFDFFVPSLFLRDRLDVASFIRDFDGPLLLIHGESDVIIPLAHGRKLAALNPKVEFHAVDAGHNDVAETAEYWDWVLAFAERALQGTEATR